MCYFDMFHFWCTFIVENHDDPHNDPSPLSYHSVNRCGPNTQNETYIKMTHLLNFIYFLYKLRFSPKKLQQWLKLDSSLLKAVYWAVECVL